MSNEREPPPRRALNLIDVAVGAGSLAARAGSPVVRAAGHVGGSVYSRARRVVAPVADPALDWALWATQTLAEVGSLERRRAKDGVHTLIGAVGSVVAAEPGVQGMVQDLAESQLDPLVERALPLVLDRLNDNPEAVRRIVQDQSAGIMTEATQSARHTARHADDVVDSLAHRFFRRNSRVGGDPEPDLAADPEVAESAAGERAVEETAAGETAAGEPGADSPVIAAAEPSALEPEAREPGATELKAREPKTTAPKATEPVPPPPEGPAS